MRFFSLLASLFVGLSLAHAADKPNVVLLYADDLGYGDVSCYGSKTISTPHIDKLAAEGLRFTDGHCSAATCTPSRFAMLTGEYAFRQKGTGILPGDAKMIIPPGRATLASVFKGAGYQTGVVGKWHLGLGDGALDWNGAIQPGPLEIGFDHCFIMAATGDRVAAPGVYDVVLTDGKKQSFSMLEIEELDRLREYVGTRSFGGGAKADAAAGAASSSSSSAAAAKAP